jgi:hypothetical protein
VDRPTVQLDLYESLRPQSYDQDLSDKEKQPAASAAQATRDALAKAEPELRERAAVGGLAANAVGRAARPQRRALNLRQGVQAAAQASELGELFQYQIASPVTLERNQSALIPVLNTTVTGERFSIYEQDVLAKHPLYGLELTNTSDLYLMEGPLTVFDEGRYAGDALIEGLSPGNQRLISYGVDLDVEVAPETTSHNRSLRQVRIVRGTMYVKYEQLQEKVYTIKNSSQQEKKVLVVVPKSPDWTLADPQAEETTRDSYRFLVSCAAGESVKLHVQLERTINERVLLTNLDHNAILIYVRSDELSAAATQALEEVAQRKAQLQQLQETLSQVKADLSSISTQQQRIRQNMEQLDKSTDLYARYVSKLGEQEDRVEQLQSRIEELEQEIRAQRKSISEYIDGLNIG